MDRRECVILFWSGYVCSTSTGGFSTADPGFPGPTNAEIANVNGRVSSAGFSSLLFGAHDGGIFRLRFASNQPL